MANAAERAHKLMLEAASAGSRQALLELGIDFFNGRGVPRDVRRARLIFSQLAKIGASETALFYLSDIYLTGKGVPRNVPLGMTYLQRAAQGSDVRRIGKECVCTCGLRGSRYHYKKH